MYHFGDFGPNLSNLWATFWSVTSFTFALGLAKDDDDGDENDKQCWVR